MILAVCPLLSWGKTEGKQFWKRARVPGICALVLFAILMAYFLMYLLPSYDAMVAAGGSTAASVTDYGPSWYYNGMAVVGFIVASLLFFNSLFMLGRGLRAYKKKHGKNVFASLFGMFKDHAATYGGFVAHISMAIILVGLIGSSMYVTEKVEYLEYDPETGGTNDEFVIQDFTLKYTGNSIDELENGTDILYTLEFDVYKGEEFVGHVAPSVQLVSTTQQQKLLASVIGFPTEDLFVVYRGVNTDGDFALDVRVNPCISLVWVGFGLMMVGILIALIGKRKPVKKGKPGEIDPGDGNGSSGGVVAVLESVEVTQGADGSVTVVSEEVVVTEDASDADAEPSGKEA